MGAHRLVLHYMQRQMQFDPSALAPSTCTVKRPTHARQRPPQRAVVRHPVSKLDARIDRTLFVKLGGQVDKDLLQQRRVQQVLRFGETAQTHRTGTNLLLHSLKMAGRAESPHSSHHRIEQTKEIQTQVIDVEQPPLRIAPGRMTALAGLEHLVQPLPEILDQAPTLQLAFGQNGRDLLRHAATKTQAGTEYKLQFCYSSLTN